MKRHIHFGSTPNFDNLHQQVLAMSDKKGRLKFANYDPSLGKPPTDAQKELLQSYKPVLPIITFTGSEKLHGENMAVCYTRGELWVQGRNHIRTISDDQNGMAQFVEATKDYWLNILNTLTQQYSIDTSSHTIVIDCEWAGANIQKGNAACSGTDKAVYIFDYFRIVDNATEHTEYIPSQAIPVNPNVGIYLLSSFGTYSLQLDFNQPALCAAQLAQLALQIEDQSPIAKYFDKPNNVGEGVYLWGTYQGEILRVKAKGEKHGGKPKTNTKATLSEDDKSALIELADSLTPVWRITQGITETGATTREHLGSLVKWVVSDIIKEESPTLVASGVELKQLQRYIATQVKAYYFDLLANTKY